MAPSQYKKGGEGLTIRYAVAGSPLGRLLVAATERGVCAVTLGERDLDLVAALKAEYPASTLRLDRGALAKWTTQVLDHVAGRSSRLDLPLDIRATAFQWQVWNALAAIPRGETRSYGEVAAAIGRPRATRAVARACATNPVALAIPCHRVVPAAGGVGGYRWGAKRKTAILARETRPRSG
jgi:AraC family transcriptional regulator of adaptative response/methylated-DNA-[protein]-cysteine methyltransferase